jgi:hypothetical protein
MNYHTGFGSTEELPFYVSYISVYSISDLRVGGGKLLASLEKWLSNRWQLDTSTTPLPMTLLSTGNKTMSFMSMGNTSMRYTSTGNGRSIAHNNYKFAPYFYQM